MLGVQPRNSRIEVRRIFALGGPPRRHGLTRLVKYKLVRLDSGNGPGADFEQISPDPGCPPLHLHFHLHVRQERGREGSRKREGGRGELGKEPDCNQDPTSTVLFATPTAETFEGLDYRKRRITLAPLSQFKFDPCTGSWQRHWPFSRAASRRREDIRASCIAGRVARS